MPTPYHSKNKINATRDSLNFAKESAISKGRQTWKACFGPDRARRHCGERISQLIKRLHALHHLEKKRMTIVGGSGTGKSTAMLYLLCEPPGVFAAKFVWSWHRQ